MSFARILRSSALMGGAQVATLAVAFIRTKIIAQLLGPAGVGLVGILTSFNGNVSTLAAWGLGTSGVRLIASAEQEQKASRRAAVRKLGSLLSWIALLVTVLLFLPTSYLTFGSYKYTSELLIGGMAVPCIVANSIWSSILQADGEIKSLAKVQAASALMGLCIGIPLIYYMGTIGVALSLFLAASAPLVFTWRLVRQKFPTSGDIVLSADLRKLINMGSSLVVVGLAAQVSAYCVRWLIIKNQGADLVRGLEDAGYYHAAIAIAGSLPALVFTAMGTDFFPQVAASKNEAEAKQLTEKQILAGLLLALPIITGLLTLNRLGIHFLYDDKFDAALPLLDWMIWGVFLRLLAWPLGYWMLAKGAPTTVVIVELSSNLAMVVLPVLLIPRYGLVGAAMAYFYGYLVYAVIMLMVARKRAGAWLSLRTLSLFIIAASILASAQYLSRITPGIYWGIIPTALVAGCCLWGYRKALSHRTDS